MKLISAYIENFGGLSQYEITFQDGITMIEEANGFGKTTLAEFIRAMFYGFPKSSPRTIEKNLRKKYKPWQGGPYGGNLVFENNDETYRIERSFGDTPRSDKVAIYNVRTGKKTNAFSDEIGVDLFGIDSESFARSTYLPQLHEAMNLSTDSIQAKLGNLVEDSNDVNNYDDAMKRLKAARMVFEKFRGEGGKCYELQAEISITQEQLEQAKDARRNLKKFKTEYHDDVAKKAKAEEQLTQLQENMDILREAELKQTLTNQYHDKKQDVVTLEKTMEEIEEAYPNGMPSEEEFNQVEPLFDQMIACDSEEKQAKVNEDDQYIVEEGKVFFHNQIPSEDEFVTQKQNCLDYVRMHTALEHTNLTQSEQVSLQSLKAFFAQNLPDAMYFSNRQKEIDNLKRLEVEKSLLKLSDDETYTYQSLKVFFANGLPTEEELQENFAKAREMDTLSNQNIMMYSEDTKQLNTHIEANKQANKPNMIMMIIGALLLVLGIVLIMKVGIVGAVFIGLGLVCLLLGAMKSKQSHAVVTTNVNEDVLKKINQNKEKIERLNREVLAFVSTYITDQRSYNEKLLDIETRRRNYIRLSEKEAAQVEKRNQMEEEICAIKASLQSKLSIYFDDIDTYENALQILKEKDHEYHKLVQKANEQELHSTEYKHKVKELQESMRAFLFPYYGVVEDENFSNYVHALETKTNVYKNAMKRLHDMKERQVHIQMNKDACVQAFEKFIQTYQLTLSLHDREAFQSLKKQVHTYHDGKLKHVLAKADLDAFYQQNEAILKKEIKQFEFNLEEAKAAYHKISEDIKELQRDIDSDQLYIDIYQRKVDTIPELEDQLAKLTQERQECLHKRDMLDKTLFYLEESKESLSNQYLGTIKKQFMYYLEKLSGVSHEKISISPNFEVKVERLGESRELAYFSMGQSDLVMLCMRFALVDAMFEDGKPFVILDDPFVNLDDENTNRALALLTEIGKERQILYLVCNHSRAL